ncbi:hypothetical protein [Nocardioides sp. BYT-33-1]|uniref:hypothetical protein n=1 Tax=Nocardioides sp. BYT-33-1 TaxID=3416952 RepID=UPI003F53BF45
MSRARQSAAEWFVMTAIGEKPKSLHPGSLVLDGYALDWTQRTPRGLVARSSYLALRDLATVVLDAARGLDPIPTSPDGSAVTTTKES